MKQIKKTLPKRILIEPALFGDYFVAVYDERNELLVDKKYFTSGFLSAMQVAKELIARDTWKDYPIYIWEENKENEI